MTADFKNLSLQTNTRPRPLVQNVIYEYQDKMGREAGLTINFQISRSTVKSTCQPSSIKLNQPVNR